MEGCASGWRDALGVGEKKDADPWVSCGHKNRGIAGAPVTDRMLVMACSGNWAVEMVRSRVWMRAWHVGSWRPVNGRAFGIRTLVELGSTAQGHALMVEVVPFVRADMLPPHRYHIVPTAMRQQSCFDSHVSNCTPGAV